MTSTEEWPRRLVLEDVITDPDSSISEVHQRTGFAQSHVSALVAWLNECGLLVTAADPGDARRTRIRVREDTLAAITRRAGRRVDDVIAQTVGDPTQASRVLAVLDELAELLLATPARGTPAAVTRSPCPRVARATGGVRWGRVGRVRHRCRR